MVLFAFFAAMAETERENIRDATLEGLTAAARKGTTRPPPAGHHRRHAAHRSPAPRERRVSRTDPTGPDHPHRQTQGPAPPARPASTGRLPSTTKRRRTPRPSTKPTPTSPPSRRVPDGPIIAGQPYPPDFRRLLRRPPVDPTTLQVRLHRGLRRNGQTGHVGLDTQQVTPRAQQPAHLVRIAGTPTARCGSAHCDHRDPTRPTGKAGLLRTSEPDLHA